MGLLFTQLPRLLGVLLSLVWAGASLAGSEFYRIETPVSQQTAEAKALAAQVALKDLLWRVTGQKLSEKTPGLSNAFKQADQYVESFAYIQPAPSQPAGELLLQLQFSPSAIKQLVHTYQLPVWPEQRAKILVWLFKQDNGRVLLLNDPNAPEVQALQAAAKLRGRPVRWAKPWLEELAGFTPSRVLSAQGEAVLNASFSYGLDTLLIGLLNGDTGEWLLVQPDEKTPVKGADPAQALHKLADALAKRYSLGSTANAPLQTLTLTVEVASFAKWQQLMQYLKQQPQVKRLTLMAAVDNQLTLQLSLQGSLAQWTLQLAQEKRLIPMPETNTASNPPLLRYRWQQ